MANASKKSKATDEQAPFEGGKSGEEKNKEGPEAIADYLQEIGGYPETNSGATKRQLLDKMGEASQHFISFMQMRANLISTEAALRVANEQVAILKQRSPSRG